MDQFICEIILIDILNWFMIRISAVIDVMMTEIVLIWDCEMGGARGYIARVVRLGLRDSSGYGFTRDGMAATHFYI